MDEKCVECGADMCVLHEGYKICPVCGCRNSLREQFVAGLENRWDHGC
jgi:hypothetical protein